MNASEGGPTVVRGLRRFVARCLEVALDGCARRSHGALFVSPVRSCVLPPDLAVIGVGGVTLGGSGRTPVAIALAGSLAARGLRVAFLGHGYGGRVRAPTIVAAGDAVDDVGDEALIAARALGSNVPVIVAPTRSSGVAHAREFADVLVADRWLQAAPRRVARSLLVVDPGGDGRGGGASAPPDAFLEASDEWVSIGGRGARAVAFDLGGASVSELRERRPRLGLITSCAHPERVARSLASLGLPPTLHVERADHAALSTAEINAIRARGAKEKIERWVVDAKTGARLAPTDLAHVVLRQRVTLDDDVVARVLEAVERSRTCNGAASVRRP